MASLDSKHGKLKEFNKLLSDFKDLKPHTDERKKRKIDLIKKALTKMKKPHQKCIQK